MSAPPAPDAGKLALATLAAALAAALVLVVAVLPAEYGLDPTGMGAAAGFTRLRGDAAAPSAPATQEAPPLYELRAAWRLAALPLAEREGTLTRAQPEAAVVVPMQVANLTSVTATLTWEDDDLVAGQRTDGDTLEVSIRGPGELRSAPAQAKNAPGEAGTATASVTVRSVPFPREDASVLTFDTAADTGGVGNWTFLVRLYSAGGVEGSAERDPGQAWRLVVAGEAYEMAVEKQAERAGDRVSLTLAPGRSIEYKFAMDANATLRYRWTSSAPLYWDLHAEEAGKDPDAFTRYQEGTSDGEEGTITAPFDGRHGWFWRNDGASPVVVTLDTTGDYRILGVPP